MNLRKKLNEQTKQRLSLWDIGKLVTLGLLLTVAKFKKCTENQPKIRANTVHASINNSIPNKIPSRPIQCYNIKECNSTFHVMHKLMKHTRE